MQMLTVTQITYFASCLFAFPGSFKMSHLEMGLQLTPLLWDYLLSPIPSEIWREFIDTFPNVGGWPQCWLDSSFAFMIWCVTSLNISLCVTKSTTGAHKSQPFGSESFLWLQFKLSCQDISNTPITGAIAHMETGMLTHSWQTTKQWNTGLSEVWMDLCPGFFFLNLF